MFALSVPSIVHCTSLSRSGNLQLVATKLPRTLEVYVVVSFYGTSIIDIQLTAHLFAFKGFIFLQVTKLG